MSAIECAQSIGFDKRSLAWQVPEVHAGQPLVATHNIGNAAVPVPPPCREPPPPAVGGGSTAAGGAAGGHIAVLQVLDVLRDLDTNKVYLPSAMPRTVGMRLNELLPPEWFAAIFEAVS